MSGIGQYPREEREGQHSDDRCAVQPDSYEEGVWALAADTDGIDGVEDNAGALVTPDSLQRCEERALKPAVFADRNDSYRLFEALGDLVVSGPTHTNVNDFRALLVL